MNICIQINIDNEDSKGGIAMKDYDVLSAYILRLKNVKLRGIMAIPQADKPCNNSFAKMSHLYKKYDYLDTLSMGMSKDFVTAIENGANMLRIGQEIFGKEHNDHNNNYWSWKSYKVDSRWNGKISV